eukprot:15445580-Alexandrium_andersonii.AAC.1
MRGRYETTKTLNGGKGKGKMLGFSLLEAKSKDDRAEISNMMRRSQMFGFYGNLIWGKRNVAKFATC